ncbi:MAG: hypothetical protein ACK5RL_12995 [Acidimicrobiales bacterium]
MRPGADHTSRFETALQLAGRWKGVLVVALAGLTTAAVVTVVTVYRSSDPTTLAGRDQAAVGAPGVNAVAGRPAPPVTQPTTTAGGALTGRDDAPASPATDTPDPAVPAAQPGTVTADPPPDRTPHVPSGSADGQPPAGSATEDGPAAGGPGGSPATTAPPVPTTTPGSPADPAGSTPTTAELPRRIQAEGGTTLGSARIRTDHPGYSGGGYLGDLITPGSGIALPAVTTGHVTTIRICYATPPFGGSGDRTVTLLDGTRPIGRVVFIPTGGPDQWTTVEVAVDLPAGSPIALSAVVEPSDSGWVNIDWFEFG